MHRFLATVVASLFVCTALSAAVVVEGVRVWSEEGSTRIVLDLSEPATHHLFTLRKPNRVVLDLEGGALSESVINLPENVGFVRSIRAAQRGGKDLRIVLDLNAAVQPRSFYAGPARGSAERLVIDLGERVESPAKARVKPAPRDLVIAVDPGHGGRDPGAIGMRKTREKDVVLSISRRLVSRLNSEPGLSAFLVRDSDVLVPHRERMEQARAAKADLFVSIHADAVEDRRARGSSVYALSLKGASDEASRRLAAEQNASDLIGGVSLSDKEPVLASVLMDLSQTASINSSIDIGDYVIREMARVNKMHRSTVQQAGFAVLKSPDVPSILIETAYISNPEEEKNLASAAHQRKLAGAIFTGIRNYFYAHPPADTLVASFVREQDGQRDHTASTARTYTIAAGDTLSGIADRYRVSLRTLRRENQLKNDRIRVGQVIRIPIDG